MKRRVVIWASAGFLIACCFVIYTFVVSPEQRIDMMRNPLIEIFAFISFPFSFAFPHMALPFWWVPMINAATYATIGAIVELLRRKPKPGFAV